MFDRACFTDWYLRNRRRSKMLFDAVVPEAYAARPIALRNPICFYEGHIPAFAVNTLIRRGLERPGVNPDFEILFERGIDPEDPSTVNVRPSWPSREEILAYGRACDRTILDAIARADLEDPSHEVLRGGHIAQTICEHEEMHDETVCYLLHRLPHAQKTRPARAARAILGNGAPALARVRVPAGRATLGLDPATGAFGWDNEIPSHQVDVPAFDVDVHDVTNAAFLEFVEAGGYRRQELWSPEGWAWIRKAGVEHPGFWIRDGARWLWRGLFEDYALPAAWPVYVSHAEATAYARWQGRRLPTEAEYHRAAYGTPSGEERPYPWGSEPPDATRGNFDFRSFDPVPVGSFPAGASAFGVHDLVGNGWEWTSTPFAGFEGFEPMPAYPNYSVDFFDNQHFVLKGGSPVTASSMVRRTFRNWFRGTYPYVYAAFRTVE
jgi:ergothioneine biosynthesis protein EgtB